MHLECHATSYEVACLDPDDYRTVTQLDASHADSAWVMPIAVVVLAERHETGRIFSFDERHFRAVVSLQGGSFELLPADF